MPFRLAELELKHGKLQPLADIDFSAEDKDHVTVQVHYEGSTRVVKLNVHQTISQVRRLLAKKFKVIGAHKVKLYVGAAVDADEGHSFLLVYPNRTLLNYRMHDGDDIWMY